MVHKFQSTLSQLLPKIELGAFSMSVLGFVLHLGSMPLGKVLLSVGLYALAGVFFLRAYLPPAPLKKEGPREFNDVAHLVVWQVLHVASSVATIGFLYYLLRETGFKQMLLVGTSVLSACLLCSWLLAQRKKDHWMQVRPSIFKAGSLALLGVYVLYMTWSWPTPL